jgi:hypothetical protein
LKARREGRIGRKDIKEGGNQGTKSSKEIKVGNQGRERMEIKKGNKKWKPRQEIKEGNQGRKSRNEEREIEGQGSTVWS